MKKVKSVSFKKTKPFPPRGKVFLVGAGPGDLGLLTLRGKELLETCEAVVYDGLIPQRMLQFATRAEKIFAGKISSGRQQWIHETLLKLARQGKQVVRLKGGDPFVFGRGGEEALFLKSHAIPFEIVPGVSAGHAVPAYAGIPVTDRRLASQVTFVTANEDPEKSDSSVDWNALARISGTLVLFMGVKSLEKIVKTLLQEGKSPSTPVSMIEQGTLPLQRTVSANLSTIVDKARKNKIQAPAITVIGEVNRFHKEIRWFENRPLFGKKIILTRDSAQSSKIAMELESSGAEVIDFPVIHIAPPKNWQAADAVMNHLEPYDWILFASAPGVRFFFSRLQARGRDARVLSKIKIAAVGSATEAELRERSVVADLVPPVFTAQAMVKALSAIGEIAGRHFLLPRADIAPDYLPSALQREGGQVTSLIMYRTLAPPSLSRENRLTWLKDPAALITFTSSSTVRHFYDGIPTAARQRARAKMVSIGPMTSQTLREQGLKVYREAKEHSLSGLVKTLVQS